ncbi:hypothetical protein DOTSEDRAFT_116750, partial [Dothistroma septosporum NZE10]
LAHAAVIFTNPQAGINVVLKTGTDIPYVYFETTWIDDGGQPATSELSNYTLYLMVGGNSPSNSHQVSISAPSQRLEAPGFGAIGLHADSAGSLEDGFYVNMVASAREEGHYTGNMAFFSDRFNLIGLTGSTPVEYQSAAAALESTDGPKTFNNLTAVGGPTTNAPASTASPS